MTTLPRESLSILAEAIAGATGEACAGLRARSVAGGCISRNFCLEGERQRYFLKLCLGAQDMFAAEADGLAALARCSQLVVPQVVCRGEFAGRAFLVLEWLDLDKRGDAARLGEALAALHAIRFPRFGWQHDNFIGSTPQVNEWHDDWGTFFAARRLAPQLRLAASNGAPQLAQRAAPLLVQLPRLLVGQATMPSLLHGDLWSGNQGFVGGRPALFDPAVYAGDADTDLATCELFGGFAPRFYDAYRAVRPASPSYPRRRIAYQLYHVLNHYNLFGGGYAKQAEAMIGELVAQLD
jgi:protein-ribulosamine 3-kinase